MSVATGPVVDIPVRADDRQRWQSALIRGQERRLEIKPLRAGLLADGEFRTYHIASHSAPNTWHTVTVTDREGDIGLRAGCDCNAGMFGCVCQHMALGVDAANAWPFPIARPRALALPPAFGIGDAVRVAATGQRGIVADRERASTNDWIYWVDGPRGRKLGAFTAEELRRDAVAPAPPSARETANLLLAQANRRAS